MLKSLTFLSLERNQLRKMCADCLLLIAYLIAKFRNIYKFSMNLFWHRPKLGGWVFYYFTPNFYFLNLFLGEAALLFKGSIYFITCTILRITTYLCVRALSFYHRKSSLVSLSLTTDSLIKSVIISIDPSLALIHWRLLINVLIRQSLSCFQGFLI